MLVLRPCIRDDADAVLAALEARDRHDFGVGDFTRRELTARWRDPEFVPEADSVVADDGGAVVGYATIISAGAIAFVEPAREGEGIGSSLLAWLERRARELGRNIHRQAVPERNDAALELLSHHGYARVRSLLEMTIPVEPSLPTPVLPEGIVMHELDVAADAASIHAADEIAFADNADYEPETFDAFISEHLQAPAIDPELSRVARRGEAIAAFALCQRRDRSRGYIDLLAVSPSERRRGLGITLLQGIFANCAAAGLREVALGVASDNPRAQRLYCRAGMIERNRIHVLEKPEPRRAAR